MPTSSAILAQRLKASVDSARDGKLPVLGPREDGEIFAAAAGLPPPSLRISDDIKGSHVRLSKPLEGLSQIIDGRSDFFAELAQNISYEVQRLLRFTLLGYTNPLHADIEQKAERQVSEGLRTVLEHLAAYVDKVFVASASAYRQKPKAREKTDEQLANENQLDTVIQESQDLQTQLAKSDEQALRSKNIMNQLRNWYYQDLEAQRNRFRQLLARHLPDLEDDMIYDLMNVRFFSPDAYLDEGTQDAVKRKVAALQADFNIERETFQAQLRLSEKEVEALRRKVNFLQVKLGYEIDESENSGETVKPLITHEDSEPGKRRSSQLVPVENELVALEDALQKQAEWIAETSHGTEKRELQALIRAALAKVAAAKNALHGNSGAKSDHQTLQQKVDAAENTARLEASRREILEAEKTRLTQEFEDLKAVTAKDPTLARGAAMLDLQLAETKKLVEELEAKLANQNIEIEALRRHARVGARRSRTTGASNGTKQAFADSENPGQDSHDPRKGEADADDADAEPILCDREVQTEMQVFPENQTSKTGQETDIQANPAAVAGEEVVAHPREQGGDERDSGSEPKSETEDALRLEHSGGLPESKEEAEKERDLEREKRQAMIQSRLSELKESWQGHTELDDAMFELVDSAQHAADCALQHGQRILEAQEKALSAMEGLQGKTKGEAEFLNAQGELAKLRLQLDGVMWHEEKRDAAQKVLMHVRPRADALWRKAFAKIRALRAPKEADERPEQREQSQILKEFLDGEQFVPVETESRGVQVHFAELSPVCDQAVQNEVLPGPSNQTSGVMTAAAQPGDGGSQLPETAAVAGEEVVAHPREQGGDERDSGSEPKSETEDALRLEHSGGLPESKEPATLPETPPSAAGRKSGVEQKEPNATPAVRQSADGKQVGDSSTMAQAAKDANSHQPADSKEPSTHPASPRAGEQASGDPQQVASAEASNVVQSKGPSQSQEPATLPETPPSAAGRKSGVEQKEPNATPVRHGLEAEDPNETEDPNSVSPAQFKESRNLQELVEELKATLAAKNQLIDQLSGVKVPGLSPSRRSSSELPGREGLPPAASSQVGPSDMNDVSENFVNAIADCHQRVRRKSQVLAQSVLSNLQNKEPKDAETGATTATAGGTTRPPRNTLPGRLLGILGQPKPPAPKRRRKRRARASVKILAHQASDLAADLSSVTNSGADADASDSEESPSSSDSDDKEVTLEHKLVMTVLSWKDLPKQILQWLKSNLRRSEEAHAHSVPWEPTSLDTWPELSQRNRLQMVEEFEDFLDQLGRFRPSRYESKTKLRERLNHSEPPKSRRRSRSQGQIHPFYEFPLDVEPAQVSARLREALPLKRSRAGGKDDSPGSDSCSGLDLTVMGRSHAQSPRSSRSPKSSRSPVSRSPERREHHGRAVGLASVLANILAQSTRRQKRWALRRWTHVTTADRAAQGRAEQLDWTSDPDTGRDDRWRGRRAERDGRARRRREDLRDVEFSSSREPRYDSHARRDHRDHRDPRDFEGSWWSVPRDPRDQRDPRSVPRPPGASGVPAPPSWSLEREPREPREPRPARIYQRPRLEDLKRPRWQAASRFEDYVGCVSWNYKEPRVPLALQSHIQKSPEARAEEWSRVLQNRFKLSDLREANSLRSTTGLLKPVIPLPSLISARRINPHDAM